MSRVELRKITHEFGGVRVLDELDLAIDAGTYLVLLGASGGGKSTLLRIISGLLSPTDGSVWIDGKCVDRVSPRNRGIAITFQQDALFPHQTAGEFLKFGSADKNATSDRVKEIAMRMKIDGLLDRYPDQLSGGELRRVSVGKAMMRGATIRLLDEPLSALDTPIRFPLQQDILCWHQQDTGTTIHVTHDGQEAMAMADVIAVMDAGKVVQVSNAEELYQRPRTLAVARSLGSPPINLIAGSIVDSKLEIESVAFSAQIQLDRRVNDQEVWIGVRPEAWSLQTDDPENGTLSFSPERKTFRFVEGYQRCTAVAGDLTITASMVNRDCYLRSEEVDVKLVAQQDQLHFFDSTTGKRIEGEFAQ